MKTIYFMLFVYIALALAMCTNKEEEYRKQFKPDCEYTITTMSDGVYFTPTQFDGMRLFMKFCNKCHPGGEKGKGPSLNDKNLPNFLIHTQVRVGFGKMPDFSTDEISKKELEKITAFVSMLHDIHSAMENKSKKK